MRNIEKLNKAIDFLESVVDNLTFNGCLTQEDSEAFDEIIHMLMELKVEETE